jgi:uncharacterized coiled-coil protein SlyX
MKKLLGFAAAVMVLATGAAAQYTTNATVERKSLAVMGRAVKGAPYSADEITEASQTLLDGTHISRQSQITVYRDGEGRVRRDTADQITIWDPVANVSYTLDPQLKTAFKTTMGRIPDSGATKAVAFTYNGQTVQMNVMLDKLKAMQDDMQSSAGNVTLVDGTPANAEAMAKAKAEMAAAMEKLQKSSERAAKIESLGRQTFWGVEADGTRETSTIEAGAIGNDRPIAVVSERWYAADLKTVMMSKHSDPRTGEETFRLSNVRRGEPGQDLFMVPPGYTVTERK